MFFCFQNMTLQCFVHKTIKASNLILHCIEHFTVFEAFIKAFVFVA